MQDLTYHGVVDQLVRELSERRRTTSGRRAAYAALVRAILKDRSNRHQVSSECERDPVCIAGGHATRAA
jgi:hypothetical protein